MAAKDSSYIAQFDLALEGWTDERFASRQNLRDLAMFHLYLVNLADEDGWRYDGHSFSQGSPMGRLVVRGTIDGVPHVVFTSARTTTGCIHTFLRKMDQEMLEWVPDKFRS